MKRQPRILAGTAIGLFMASAPLGAMPLPSGALSPTGSTPPLVRVQVECQEGESAEACAARQGDSQNQEQPRHKNKRQQAEQPAPEPQAEQPRHKNKRQQAEQPAAQEQPAPEPQAEQPRRNKRQAIEEAAPQQQPAPEPQAEQPRRNKRQAIEEAAPQQQPAPEPQAEQPRRNKRQAIEEAAPQQQPAPEPQAEQPRRNKRQAIEEAAPQVQPAPESQTEQHPRRNKRQAIEEAAPQQQPAPEPQAERPAPKRNKDKNKDKAPAQEAAPELLPVPVPEAAPQPQAETPAERPVEKPVRPTPEHVPTPAPSPETTAPSGEAPATGAPVQGEQPTKPGKPGRPGKRPVEQPAAGEQQPAEKPAEQPAAGEQPAQQPVTGEQPVQRPATGEQPAQRPATGERPAAGEQPTQRPAERGKKPVLQGEAPVNPNEAPLLDSEKDAAPAEATGKPSRGEKPGRPGKGGQGNAQGGEQRPRPAPVDQGPPPADDRAATEAAQPVEIQPVTAERGKRRDRAPHEDIRRQPRPEGTEVLREFGDRLIIQLNNQVIVESNERPRMTRNAQEVYYEDLPRGRTREVIVRDNGNQIITIRNRYGDIVRRSRVTPDGREYVLSYVDDQHYDDMDQWRDPGLDLPPMQLRIPRNEYILDAQYVEDPEAYYDFLEQPPVERVQRLYSVDEVKRSARVRDIARRVDLDTLNFEFGSASISEAEIAKLEGVANAMEKLLAKNPAETFLIEGHTDAVGSDLANLALSDRRAESVADALTNVFGIPPENLTTQGYGERYLKVKTESPERENRRVAIRRITPLVAPVASAR